MPGGDRTGPMGMGAMTGRGAGFCAGAAGPGRGFGMGFGRGRGFGGGGRGWRNRFYATGVPGWMAGSWGASVPLGAAPEQELTGLKQQAEYFGQALEEIRGRIQELEGNKSGKK